MSGEVVVALITLLGSAIGTIGGIFATNKMTAYRIEQLEKKVDKHNQVVERMYEAENNICNQVHLLSSSVSSCSVYHALYLSPLNF